MLIIKNPSDDIELHVNSITDPDDEISVYVGVDEGWHGNTAFLTLPQIEELRDHLNFILEKYNGK